MIFFLMVTNIITLLYSAWVTCSIIVEISLWKQSINDEWSKDTLLKEILKILSYVWPCFFLAEFDAQINTKLKEIERMKLEVSQLKLKRKRCDNEVDRLHKRLLSCDNALKEIPGSSTASNGMWLCSIWRCFQGLSCYLGCHAIQCCVTIVIVATKETTYF